MPADVPRPLRVVALGNGSVDHGQPAWVPGEGSDPSALPRLLAACGITQEFIDPGRGPLNPLAGVNPLLEAIDPLRAVRVLLRRRRADVVSSTCEGPAFLPLLLRRAFAFRPPIVLYDPILSEDWPLRNRVLDVVIRRADGIGVISSFQKEYIARRWERRDGVEVLGYLIDDTFWHPAPQVEDGYVLSVGKDHGRDYDLLLAAWEGLAGPGRRLVIRSGRIPPERPLPAGVEVLRQRLSEKELRQLYAGSSFVAVPLRPTLNASGVTTVFEAMASGRACVVSDNPAIRDFLHHEETCLVVPEGNVEAFRAACARLMAEPHTRARLGANARARLERDGSTAAFAARYCDFLRRTADRA